RGRIKLSDWNRIGGELRTNASSVGCKLLGRRGINHALASRIPQAIGRNSWNIAAGEEAREIAGFVRTDRHSRHDVVDIDAFAEIFVVQEEERRLFAVVDFRNSHRPTDTAAIVVAALNRPDMVERLRRP